MRTAASSLLLVLLSITATVSAHACSCFRQGPPCAIRLGSSLIFRGTVIRQELIPDIRIVKRPDGTETKLYGNGAYKVTLQVAETFSGESAQEQTIYTDEQGSACGYPFRTGREYVVFAYARDGQQWASRCSRTALLEPGVENADVTWMRGYAKAPLGSEIMGKVLLREHPTGSVPAKLHLSGARESDTVTDSEGKYVFHGMPAGDYSVSLTLPDGFAADRTESKISLAEKGCAEIDWYANYEGRIMGRVVDENDAPVADLRVEVRHPGELYSAHNATTTIDGSYVVEDLGPGDYLVSVRNAATLAEEGASTIYFPHTNDAEHARIVVLGPSATYDHVDFRLKPLRKTLSVKVKVLEPDGSPAPAGLYLFAFPNHSTFEEPTRTGVTDGSGTATLPLFPGWEYAVSVALDRNHAGCGFGLLATTETTTEGTVTIKQPEACAK